MTEDYKLRLAVISGASNALKYKDENPKATEQEILQYITENSNEIASKIGDASA